MTKQEQIEEMAVIGCVRNPQAHTAEECGKCGFKQGMCDAYRHAEALYNAGYRKVPENAVVLTKEEYDKLGLFEESVQEYKSDNGQFVLVKERKTLQKYSTDVADFIRKETAKEILLLLGKGYDETEKTEFNNLQWYKEFCRELKHRYGAEVEE